MDYWLTNWDFLSWAVKQVINLLLLVSSRNCPAHCQNAFFFFWIPTFLSLFQLLIKVMVTVITITSYVIAGKVYFN